MSDIHLLNAGQGSVRLAFHFPVPDVDNDVGVNYREALLRSGLGGSTQMPEGTDPGHITPAERAQIAAGERWECVRTLTRAELLSAGETPAVIQATVRAYHLADKAKYTAELQMTLQFYGYTADEA